MSEVKQVIVEGILEWAHLAKANEMSGKYQVDVCQLDKKAVKALEAAGLVVQDGAAKGKENKGQYVTPKATRPVTVVDSKKNTFSDLEAIGNGTRAKVAIRAFPYNFKGKEGVGAGLQAIQILELKEYSNLAMFSEEDGFVAQTQSVGIEDPWAEETKGA